MTIIYYFVGKMLSWLKMKNNIAVWCNTEGKAEKFIKYIESIGLTWYGFSIFGYACYDKYKSDTCYCLSNSGNGIQYGSHEYFASTGYEIVSFDKFMEEVGK